MIVNAFFLFSFSFWTFALLKVVFNETMVDLKSCDIANSVPNSSLTYKHKKHRGTCGCFEESSI
jgi:hypothetical protein